MKRITNKTDRRLVLGMLRTAVYLHIAFWDECDEIDVILDRDDAGSLLDQIARGHAGELHLSDLDAIEARFREINPAAVNNLSEEAQRTLWARFQYAVHLRSGLLDIATSLAKALGCTREEALEEVRGFVICVDTGMELDERDLQMLLGEPEAKNYVRVGGPLGSLLLES
jgi:hypothetical protein